MGNIKDKGCMSTPSPLSAGGGGGGEPLKKFKKRGGLTGPQLLEGGCWERGDNVFQKGSTT